MGRKELHFQIPESMLDLLDLEAMSRGTTRSELIRRIVNKATVAAMSNHRLVQVDAKVDDVQHRKIKMCAEKSGLTMSSVMRILIEKELRE